MARFKSVAAVLKEVSRLTTPHPGGAGVRAVKRWAAGGTPHGLARLAAEAQLLSGTVDDVIARHLRLATAKLERAGYHITPVIMDAAIGRVFPSADSTLPGRLIMPHGACTDPLAARVPDDEAFLRAIHTETMEEVLGRRIFLRECFVPGFVLNFEAMGAAMAQGLEEAFKDGIPTRPRASPVTIARQRENETGPGIRAGAH